jgi:hypothetical protein
VCKPYEATSFRSYRLLAWELSVSVATTIDSLIFRHSTRNQPATALHLMTISNDDIVVVIDNSTEASSLSHASTVSTATAGSSVTPPPPVIQQPRVSPPRTVHIVLEPVPYAQLCFDPQQNTLKTLLVGKSRASKYTPVLDEYPDLTDIISSQSSSVDLSTGWNTDTSSSSSSSSGDTSWKCSAPQEIVWLDKEWLYDDGSDYSDTRRALLHDSESPTDDITSIGCGKKFLRSVSLCKLKPHYRVQPSGSNRFPPKQLELKRFSLGKHCRYLTLD